jgi:hypothetical protein
VEVVLLKSRYAPLRRIAHLVLAVVVVVAIALHSLRAVDRFRRIPVCPSPRSKRVSLRLEARPLWCVSTGWRVEENTVHLETRVGTFTDLTLEGTQEEAVAEESSASE